MQMTLIFKYENIVSIFASFLLETQLLPVITPLQLLHFDSLHHPAFIDFPVIIR